MIEGVKDGRSITADWMPVQELIDGVRLKEVKNVAKDNGYLTELFRRDWSLDDGVVDQAFQVTLFPGAISAWHTHGHTVDRLFVVRGQVKVVLYDDRPESPTRGRLNEFRLGDLRPALVVVPCGVWHGVQNIGDERGAVINLVDAAYQYDDPDHWRIPQDSPEIPYRFS